MVQPSANIASYFCAKSAVAAQGNRCKSLAGCVIGAGGVATGVLAATESESGNRCFSVDGENPHHAIFGNQGPSKIVSRRASRCHAWAYGARFVVAGPDSEREIAAAEYFTQPTMQNVKKENVFGDDELLTHLILAAPHAIKSGHYEVRFKESRDWPMAFATVVVTTKGGVVAEAAVQGARPMSQNAYKIQITKTAVARA